MRERHRENAACALRCLWDHSYFWQAFSDRSVSVAWLRGRASLLQPPRFLPWAKAVEFLVLQVATLSHAQKGCSRFGASNSGDTGSMCHMSTRAKKIEMQSASSLSLRDLLTVAEAAERLKLAPKTIRKLCLSRRLTAIRVQRSWRIPLAALDEFLLERLIPRI